MRNPDSTHPNLNPKNQTNNKTPFSLFFTAKKEFCKFPSKKSPVANNEEIKMPLKSLSFLVKLKKRTQKISEKKIIKKEKIKIARLR